MDGEGWMEAGGPDGPSGHIAKGDLVSREKGEKCGGERVTIILDSGGNYEWTFDNCSKLPHNFVC